MSDLLLASAKEAACGLIISGDDFISDKCRKHELKERYPDALVVDMESCAVAHTAYVNDVPFASVRCILDMADDSYNDFEETTARISAGIVIDAIRNMD